MALSAGMIREILTVGKAGNGQVKGNQQKIGESKSQPLLSPGLKDKRRGLVTRLELKVSEGPPKGVGLGRGKRCPLRPEGGVKGHTLQRHPPHSRFPLELSSVRTHLEPAGKAQGLALQSIQISFWDAELARAQ